MRCTRQGWNLRTAKRSRKNWKFGIEIEEKNGEMKTAHGFRRADSADLIAMRLQAYLTAIVVNMKRIAAVMSA